jgi:hypothetical protein
MAWRATQQVCNGEGIPGELIFAVTHTHATLVISKPIIMRRGVARKSTYEALSPIAPEA